jgi:hypothetical protein
VKFGKVANFPDEGVKFGQKGQNMRRLREGSTYTLKDKVVTRRRHLWTAPTSTAQHSEQLKMSSVDKRLLRQEEKLWEWIAQQEVSENLIEFVREKPNDIVASLTKVPSLYSACLQDFKDLGDESFFKKRSRLKAMQIQYRYFRKFTGRHTELKNIDTQVLTKVVSQLEKDFVDFYHTHKNSNGEFDASFDNTETLYRMTGAISDLNEALAGRGVKGDDDAHRHLMSSDDHTFELLKYEKENYGDGFVRTHKVLNADEACEMLGCDREELGVYVWSGMVTPYPETILVEEEFQGRQILRQVDAKDAEMSKMTFHAAVILDMS